MVIDNFNDKTKIKMVDVHAKVKDQLKRMINAVPKDREIDWNKFREYCIELGDSEDHVLGIPTSLLDQLIEEVKDEWMKKNQL